MLNLATWRLRAIVPVLVAVLKVVVLRILLLPVVAAAAALAEPAVVVSA